MDFTIELPMKDSIGNLKKCWAFLGFLPDIGKLVIASVLLHVFFKMSHRRVLTLTIETTTIGRTHPTLFSGYFKVSYLAPEVLLSKKQVDARLQ